MCVTVGATHARSGAKVFWFFFSKKNVLLSGGEMTGFGPVFAGSRFAVLGLGKAGQPAADALRAMGAEVFVWDDFLPPKGAVKPSDVPGRLDALIMSPGIPHLLPKPHEQAVWARDAGVPILTDAELLYRAVRLSGSKARFVGITGTNGKSTTTALLAHILSLAGVPNAAGANLGPAALSLPLLGDDGVYVLEMSSYMLERLDTLRFDVAVMLNLSPDHLDRHGDMAGYAAAKREIFARQGDDCLAIIGVDDAPSIDMAAWLATRDVPMLRISSYDMQGLTAPALPGAHNAQNAAAASAAAHALGVDWEKIAEGLVSYPGLPHRQQMVAERGGIKFINDSKATNADAASRAMGCYDEFIWIAGGVAKAGGIEELRPYFSRVKKAFFIGKDGRAFAETFGPGADYVETLAKAVPEAFEAAWALGVETVLFSPAAASFDQFPNFEVRGEVFSRLAGADS
jgi:UDP-N-acetylmuramoylalanine--D-glutamate ligase